VVEQQWMIALAIVIHGVTTAMTGPISTRNAADGFPRRPSQIEMRGYL